jgi:hypothetical protein
MSRGEQLVAAVRKAWNDTAHGGTEKHRDISLFDPNTLKRIQYTTRLDPRLLTMDGMSGAMFRSFTNNLMAQPQISSYMEIGCWTGSTAISALYDNDNIQRHWLIDNWSETTWGTVNNTKNKFFENWNMFMKNKTPVLVDTDCFKINLSEHSMKNIDVCFCDGGNDEKGDRNVHKSLSHFYDAMGDQFIFMVDDWLTYAAHDTTFGARIRSNVDQAIADLGLKVLFHAAAPMNNNTGYLDGSGDKFGWWNGCGIFVFSK